ncbi:MAG: hypothetical protein WA123_07895 [Methylotenera sp.]
MNKTQKTISLAIGSAFALSIAAATVNAAENPFALKSLSNGYQVAEHDAKAVDGKCSTGKCGANKKTADKAKEGSCSAEKMKDGTCSAEMKAKQGSASAEKAKDGKCGSEKK